MNSHRSYLFSYTGNCVEKYKEIGKERICKKNIK